ncbi:hypothetical protein vBCbaSRXM_2 [Citromicrobium phage vB_CbaS-RXM]|nr:hypothetical protein vBCbaSRXM_2 [Citromicrobium phage vB_CbaS-RXM]
MTATKAREYRRAAWANKAREGERTRALESVMASLTTGTSRERLARAAAIVDGRALQVI